MRFLDYLAQALRNLARQKLRSALTVVAIMIGAASVTVMLTLVTSIRSFFLQQFNETGRVRQIIVTQATDLDYGQVRFGGGATSQAGIKLSDELLGKVKALPHVRDASPITSVYVFDSVQYGRSKKLSVQNFQAYEPNGVVTNTVLAGRELTEQDGAGVVTITPAYADKFGFKGKYQQLVGQTITLRTTPYYSGEGAALPATPPTGRNQAEPLAVDIPAKVIGVVSPQNDQAAIYFSLTWARGLLQTQHWEADADARPKLVKQSSLDQHGYQSFVVDADAAQNANDVATRIRALGLGASTAQDFITKQLAIFNIIGLVLGGIGGVALAVAAIGVVNTMVMATLERTREIGVMRAVGAKRSTISRLFTLEASTLGFLGGVLGIGVGLALVMVANPLVNKQLAANGIKAMNIITLPPWLIVSVVIGTTGIGLLAGLYPARRAAKLNPVDALRHE